MRIVGTRSWAARALGLVLVVGAGAASAADPTPQEMLFLWELNRARSDPAAWAQELGLDAMVGGDGELTTLGDVEARPPLALNGTLVDSARFKAEEMADNDYFDHQSHVGAMLWPNALVRSFGYPLPTQVPVPGSMSVYLLSDTSNQIEAIACGFGSGPSDFTDPVNALVALIVDANVQSLGHRKHLLGMEAVWILMTEAGVGFGSNGAASCRNYWAAHTGLTDPPRTFLTGAVFADGNGNQLYDPGEGLGGVTVSAGGLETTTGASGGWSLEVGPGTWDVTCAGGGFAGTGSARVAVAGANRQVDCVSGIDGAYVDFLPVPEPGAAAAGTAALGALAARRRRRARAG